MLFDIISNTITIACGLDEHAPAIRLDEGKVRRTSDGDRSHASKRPRDLEPGESTYVEYPLIGRTLTCEVIRTE